MPTGMPCVVSFFFSDPSTTQFYTLSLHDALPIFDSCSALARVHIVPRDLQVFVGPERPGVHAQGPKVRRDRKSTRLNSSHVRISYAVFCLKKNIPILDLASSWRVSLAFAASGAAP